MSEKLVSNAAGSAKTGTTNNEAVSEEELRGREYITPDDVLKLKSITNDFLCRAEDNIYEIEFVRFKIRDMETNTTLFEINKPTEEDLEESDSQEGDEVEEESDGDDAAPFSPRFIRYYFKPSFLRLKHVGATMEFVVGDQPVKKFRMIERHYFRDKLLKSFDFEFGFCVPKSRNSCEHIYHIPKLTEEMIDKMVENPFETRSDSFYFVDDRLIMHNKAAYAYDARAI
ncbi:GMP-PDE-delta domain-containing protein [Aphelenchoides besseyi]|nr:GMP-PDE-delta domain-containing protein [Aphelenchoides besseyi]KAI6234973.1 GMP-PDE-delta domain-containing protein [Aphelenchoides besseyi]